MREIPNFKSEILAFYEHCKELSFRILKVMGLGLKLQVHDSLGMCDIDVV